MKTKPSILGSFVTVLTSLALILGPLTGLAQNKITPAEKSSFTEVTSKLDAGGNLFLYLSTEQFLSQLSQHVGQVEEFLKQAGMGESELKELQMVINFVKRLTKNSGVEDISGVGVSSIAIEKGVYQSKFFVHHYKGEKPGYIWNLFGKAPHELTIINSLPETTSFAAFVDVDLAGIWSVIEKELAALQQPNLMQQVRQFQAQFEAAIGIPWNDFLAGFDGEVGVVITTDPNKKVEIPTPDGTLNLPEPALAFAFKVKNDVLFNRIEELVKQNLPIQTVNEGGARMRIVELPTPLPIPLRLTMARQGNYLWIASNDSLIREIDKASTSKKNLKSNAEFAKLTKGMSLNGNQFTYASPEFGKLVTEVMGLAALAARQGGSVPFNFQPAVNLYSVGVSANTDEGWFNETRGTLSASTMAMAQMAGVSGMLAAIAIPNFVKARETAQKNACRSNLQQIESGKAQWELENKKKPTDTPTDSELFGEAAYIRSKPACPAGGTYTVGKLSEKPKCSHPGHGL